MAKTLDTTCQSLISEGVCSLKKAAGEKDVNCDYAFYHPAQASTPEWTGYHPNAARNCTVPARLTQISAELNQMEASRHY